MSDYSLKILGNFEFSAREIIDVFLVAFLIYHTYKLLTHTRAIPVVLGLTLLAVISVTAQWLELDTLSWVFDIISNYIIIAVLIILQPELRRIFFRFSQVRWFRTVFSIQQVPSEEILQACMQMADEKTGGLMILGNQVSLKDHIQGGIPLNAKISRELLVSIFYGKNPLHDGAVIIEGDNVVSAATYLPLSNSSQLKRTHGARHRAGLGIAEETDCLTLIVSEEKGKLSVCFLGELREGVDAVKLKSLLMAYNNNRLKEEWETIFPKPVKGASGR